jgi:SAM-dependent methyltransferase
VPGEREELRRTFDSAAACYHRARPDYPTALYDELERAAGLRPGDRLLEVGCGTGKATIPLARRGYRIMCVELGRALAAEARRNLAGFPDVRVVHADFEGWEPATAASFELVFAATAWHWIDPGIRYRKAARWLRAGGHLAFWSAVHVFPEGGDPFFREIQPVYDQIGEGLPPGAAGPQPDELADERPEIEASGLFEEVRDPALRLGARVRRDGLPRPARHVLRPHPDAGREAGAPPSGDPPPPLGASRRTAPPPLGRRAPRRAPPRLSPGRTTSASARRDPERPFAFG